jgi:hypothetical protein
MVASRDFVRRMDSPPIEQVIPGAQLLVRYAVYRHYGIYAGGGRVIHYAGWIRGRRGLIEEIPLDEFTEWRSRCAWLLRRCRCYGALRRLFRRNRLRAPRAIDKE